MLSTTNNKKNLQLSNIKFLSTAIAGLFNIREKQVITKNKTHNDAMLIQHTLQSECVQGETG